mgnify:CR=1 FL=1
MILNDVSRKLMTDRRVREYSDVATFAFWIRHQTDIWFQLRILFQNDIYCGVDNFRLRSPRMVIWMGGRIGEAKRIFWQELYKLVKKK